MQYTAVIKQDGKWWIGWIEEVPGVNCQEATHEELIKSLKVSLAEAIDLNRKDALLSAGHNYTEELRDHPQTSLQSSTKHGRG